MTKDKDHTQKRKTDGTTGPDDGSTRNLPTPSDETRRNTVSFSDKADMIQADDALEEDKPTGRRDGAVSNGRRPSDKPGRDPVSFSDRADMIQDDDALEKNGASEPDHRAIHEGVKPSDETAHDGISFSDGADMIATDDDSGPLPDSDDRRRHDETELPMAGGEPGYAVQKSFHTASDGADAPVAKRPRKSGSNVVAEPDAPLIDRTTSLEDGEIDSHEFGLSLESESRHEHEALNHGERGESNIPDLVPKGAVVGTAVRYPVELDADLNFPEVLIALTHEDRGERVDEKTPDDTETAGDADAEGEPSEETASPRDDAMADEANALDFREGVPEDAPVRSKEAFATRWHQIRQKQFTFSTSTLGLVVLLTVAVFAAFLFGTRGPFLKGPGETDAVAPDSLVIQDSQTVSGIMHNVIEGPMFVIKGRLKNVSTEIVQNVRVTGRLFDRWDFFRTETVTGGAWLSETELTQMDAAGIRKRLSDPGGSDRFAVSIPPGHEIPFLIVFFHLPEDLNQLDRFTVDIDKHLPPVFGHE